MDSDIPYLLTNEPNMDEPVSARAEAENWIAESGQDGARYWAEFYLDQALNASDPTTASYWQAVKDCIDEHVEI